MLTAKVLKRIFFVALFCLTIGLVSFGQVKKVLNYQIVDNKKIHFGFCVGLNAMDFSFERNSRSIRTGNGDSLYMDLYQLSPGFNVNIVSELRINDAFALRFLPGLVFGQRNVFVTGVASDIQYGQVQVESNYLDFPLLIKYRGERLNNVRPYLIAGTSIRYDMAAKKENKLKLGKEQGETLRINLKPLDFYGEIGVGMDFYLVYFKLSTELKLSVGMRDILDRDLAATGLNQLTSHIVLLNFHFE